MNELEKLIKNLPKQQGFKDLANNSDVMEIVESMISVFEKQALRIEGLTNDDRFQALIAADAIKRIKQALTRAETRERNTEAKIEKLQSSKESI